MNSGRSLSGRWHLIPADWHGDQVPDHRVDLVFHDGPSGFRGAILTRDDGREIAFQALAFDGTELRIKMGGPSEQAEETPFLVLKPVADHFEGGWDLPGMEFIRLKLVRFA